MIKVQTAQGEISISSAVFTTITGAAFQLARYELGVTDLDIISSNVGIQDLCIVYIILNGGGEEGLKKMFDMLTGESEYNSVRAKRIIETVSHLNLSK